MQFEQAILGFTLRFQFAASAEVRRRNATIKQRRTNHQETMALQGIFLGAHQSYFCHTRQFQRPINSDEKIRGRAAFFIVDNAVSVVCAGIRWTAPQSLSKKLVANACSGKARFERLAVELRKPETARPAADIAENSYFMSDYNINKYIELKTRMSDG